MPSGSKDKVAGVVATVGSTFSNHCSRLVRLSNWIGAEITRDLEVLD